MRVLALLCAVLPAASASALLARDCTGNNCNRAVSGDNAKPAREIRRADCSSFMRVTVTPATSTVQSTITSTTTLSTTTTATSLLSTTSVISTTVSTTETSVTVLTTTATTTPVLVDFRRQVTVRPSAVPTYASACGDAARYSSACSCWGISATTVTAAGATVTSTVTVLASTLGVETSLSTVVTTLLTTETATTTNTELQTSTTTEVAISTVTSIQAAIRLNRALDGSLLGYVARDLGAFILPTYTTNPLAALVVKFPVSVGGLVTDLDFEMVNLQATNSQGTPTPWFSFYSSTSNYNIMSPISPRTPPNSPPVEATSPRASAVFGETAVWNVNLATGAITIKWTNSAGVSSAYTLYYFGSGTTGYFMCALDTALFEATFPTAVRVLPFFETRVL